MDTGTDVQISTGLDGGRFGVDAFSGTKGHIARGIDLRSQFGALPGKQVVIGIARAKVVGDALLHRLEVDISPRLELDAAGTGNLGSAEVEVFACRPAKYQGR